MLELTSGNVKAAMKDSGATSRDLWQVPIGDIRILDGFNVRTKSESYRSRVEYLAALILENGFNQSKPLSGYVALVDGKQTIYLTDGHRRLAAAQAAIKRGAEIENLPVVVSPKGTSVEDLTVGLVTMNDGEPLSQYEVGVVCKRLVGFGMDEKTIAKKLGMTPQRVSDLLSLIGAPKAVRDLVSDGTVSASQAIETVKKHGDKAAAKLEAGVTKARASGKKKATKKHIDDKPTCRAVCKAMVQWDADGGRDKDIKSIIDMARAAVS